MDIVILLVLNYFVSRIFPFLIGPCKVVAFCLVFAGIYKFNRFMRRF